MPEKQDCSPSVILTTWDATPSSVRGLIVPPVVFYLRKFFPLPVLRRAVHTALTDRGITGAVRGRPAPRWLHDRH
jgi:hypothetical protein